MTLPLPSEDVEDECSPIPSITAGIVRPKRVSTSLRADRLTHGITIVVAVVYWFLSGWLVFLMVMAGINFVNEYSRGRSEFPKGDADWQKDLELFGSPDTMPGLMSGFQKHLRNTFLAGIFAATPIAVTIFIVWTIESATRGIVRNLTGINIPFIGVVLAIVLIYALGVIVRSLVGKFFLNFIDRILLRVPVLKELYRAWKHISVTPGGKEGIFAKVVLVPDELGGHYTLGFTSGEPLEGDTDTCCVFVPASPNPTNGKLYFVRRERIKMLEISAEEAFKTILSGGNYVPQEVGAATGKRS